MGLISETFCPNEQYNYVIPKGGLARRSSDGDLLYLVAYADGTEDTTNPDVMQVVDVEYSEVKCSLQQSISHLNQM